MSKDTYDVGYGKPPVQTRFKKGEVNNPRGRPKGSKNLKTIFREEMDKKILINTHKGPEKVCVRRASIKRLIELALKGDSRAIIKLLEYDIKLNPENMIPDPDPNAPRTGLLVLADHAPKSYPELYARYGHLTHQSTEELIADIAAGKSFEDPLPDR